METILIVEDQQDVQNLLGVALHESGRRLLHAYDADQGWEMLQAETVDLVLLDIMMPGKRDGLDLLRSLRQEDRFNEVRVVILSARTQTWDKVSALAAGADDFVEKPFRLQVLKESLDRFLRPS